MKKTLSKWLKVIGNICFYLGVVLGSLSFFSPTLIEGVPMVYSLLLEKVGGIFTFVSASSFFCAIELDS